MLFALLTILSSLTQASSVVQAANPNDMPSWWTSDCGGHGSLLLTWNNIQVCGGGDGKEEDFPGQKGSQTYFQCTELVARYIWQKFGITSQVANGMGIVNTYTQVPNSPFHKIPAGGSVKMLPAVGDVLSFDKGDGVGHTAIVIAVDHANAQTGVENFQVIEQNASRTGTATFAMSNWQASGNGDGTVISWMTTRDTSSPPLPGGWWIGPTPSDLSVISSGSTVKVNFRASANNAGDLFLAAITTWTPSQGWQTLPAYRVKITQYSSILWDAYTEIQMPNSVFQVSVNVWSTGGYQLAPNGVRHFCPTGPCNPGLFGVYNTGGGEAHIANNIAYQATLDHGGALAAIDNDMNTEWNGGHQVPLGLVFSSPQTIQSVVVFDRKQNNPDNNQINKVQLVFSDGTVVNNIDMNSGGPRCAEVDIPQKSISWVNVVPTDASGNNGFSEIQVFDTAGTPYSGNTCSIAYSVTPPGGSGPAPLISVPTPTPTVTSTKVPSPTSTSAPTATPSPSPTVTKTATASPTATATVVPTQRTQPIMKLLTSPWTMSGNNGASEKDMVIAANTLQGKTTVQVTFNLHGTSFGKGDDEASIVFVQNGKWFIYNLPMHGLNGFNGSQILTIPLTAFHQYGNSGVYLNPGAAVTNLHARFWNSRAFTVDITSVVVF